MNLTDFSGYHRMIKATTTDRLQLEHLRTSRLILLRLEVKGRTRLTVVDPFILPQRDP
jgi:hypothetical protein